MRVLVAGGAGFIGSHFVKRLLAAGDEVRVLDKLTYSGNRANLCSEVELVIGDICDTEAVAEAAADREAIVNFAAETHVDRSILGSADVIRTNVIGTYVLLEQARAAGLRLVQVSTDEVYGDVPPGAPSSTESDPLAPSSPYSAGKAGGDLQVLAHSRTYGVDALITRGSNTYGPNQYPEKLLPLFLTNALDGEPLPMYGDGGQIRDWLYVEDHCTGIELALRQGRAGEIYNIGGGEEATNREITNLVLEHTGADETLVRHVEDRPGHDRRYSLDTTKTREQLGWAPHVRLAEGFPATAAWYRENRDWWEPIKHSGGYRAYYDKQYSARLAS
ncbi:MAG: dTDP-glucose 4,6-dehydratase [Actinobacteria bacterium]|nr:dTDP-glucose 4,6-dehydratase [Actinomycetota bacterium]